MSQTLQQKNTRFLFNRLLLVLLGGSVLFYFLMHLQARHMQKKQLELNQLNFWNAFTKAPGISLYITGEYTIVEDGTIPQELLNEPRDTSLFYPVENKWLPFKILTGEFKLNGKRYQVTTYVSSAEISHLIIKVFLTEACIFALLFVVIIYINRKTSGTLWLPFRATMKKLEAYDITRNRAIDLENETGITEFNILNAEVTQLIEKSNRAYHHQKQFVENASHEIQTPLAIIRSKLELLINQPGITEETAALLADITEANDRLSQMNRNLLLLAKIDNNQFPERQTVDIAVLLQKTINNYEKHYEGNLPQIETNIQQDVKLTANLSLIEILVNNLVANAVIHNVPSGNIHIELNQSALTVTNTGPHINVAPEQFFERFTKGNDELISTGLGLALVKQICQLYGFKPAYNYSNGTHILTVLF